MINFKNSLGYGYTKSKLKTTVPAIIQKLNNLGEGYNLDW